jgi:hypothetical protein
VNFKDMIINVTHANSDQVKAVGLLKSVCQIIFSMMGRNPQNSVAEAERFVPHFASTLAASPDVMAWTMAALLEGRADRKPQTSVPIGDPIYSSTPHDGEMHYTSPIGDKVRIPEKRGDDLEKDYTITDDASRMTIPTKEMDYTVPSITPRGFYQDAFGQYWQRRIDRKLETDVMFPVIITANPDDREPYHVPESVAKFLDQLHLTSCEAVEQGLAHVHNGVLKLYRNGENA